MAKTIQKTETKAKRKPKPPTYTFQIDETVIYLGGAYSEYKFKECVITDRSKKHKSEYYNVEFETDVIRQVPVEVLKRKEEENIEN